MDPDAALKEMRALVEKVLNDDDPSEDAAERMSELFDGLDGWISKGDSYPKTGRGSDMKIIAMRMGELPVVDELESGLEAFQAFVEGYIEAVTLDSSIDGSIMLWCNEEGKFTKAPNRLVEVGAFQDVIHGPCFISAVDNEGETVGLSVEEAKYWMRVASDWMRAISSLPEDYVSVPGEQLLVL